MSNNIRGGCFGRQPISEPETAQLRGIVLVLGRAMERHSHKPDFGAVVHFNKISLVSPTQVAFKTTNNFEINGKQTK